MDNRCETYFVGKTNDGKKHIYFSLHDVIKNSPKHVDIFDQNGEFIVSYKLNEKTKMYEKKSNEI